MTNELRITPTLAMDVAIRALAGTNRHLARALVLALRRCPCARIPNGPRCRPCGDASDVLDAAGQTLTDALIVTAAAWP